WIIDRSSAVNESSAALPPDLTIFRLRSLTESSLTAPTRVQPASTPASVVRRTRAIAARSSSCATHGAPTSAPPIPRQVAACLTARASRWQGGYHALRQERDGPQHLRLLHPRPLHAEDEAVDAEHLRAARDLARAVVWISDDEAIAHQLLEREIEAVPF